MKRRTLLGAMLAPCCSFGQPKRKDTTARIEVRSLKLERSDARIIVDGTVLNSGGRRLAKLVLVFVFQDAEEKTVSRRRGPVEEDVLEPGAEATFGFYVPDHVRAVSAMVEAEVGQTHVEVAKAGPYYID